MVTQEDQPNTYCQGEYQLDGQTYLRFKVRGKCRYYFQLPNN
jgi:hypothetical protein